MTIENTFSSVFYPHSAIIKSVFDCHISGVENGLFVDLSIKHMVFIIIFALGT